MVNLLVFVGRRIVLHLELLKNGIVLLLALFFSPQND